MIYAFFTNDYSDLQHCCFQILFQEMFYVKRKTEKVQSDLKIYLIYMYSKRVGWEMRYQSAIVQVNKTF